MVVTIRDCGKLKVEDVRKPQPILHHIVPHRFSCADEPINLCNGNVPDTENAGRLGVDWKGDDWFVLRCVKSVGLNALAIFWVDDIQKRARGNVRKRSLRRVAMTACCQRKEPRARSNFRRFAVSRSCRRSSRIVNVIKLKKGTIEITTIRTCKNGLTVSQSCNGCMPLHGTICNGNRIIRAVCHQIVREQCY